MKHRKPFFYPVLFLLFAGLLAAVIGLNIKTTALKQRYPSFENPVFRPDAKTVRLFSLGFEGLAADLVWIKGAIYFGSNYRKRGFRFPWMARLLDLATDLDPLYYDVYWYGSSLLPDVRQSIRLLKKGMKYFPNNWKFPEMIGFNYHYYLRDYKSAGKYYEIAATKPGHPPFVPSLASRFYTEAGELGAAIRVLKGFYDTTKRKDLKREFGLRIVQLQHIRMLQHVIEHYHRVLGGYPESLKALVAKGLLPHLPKEPFGGTYYFDLKDKRVKSSTDPLATPHPERRNHG